MDLRLRFQRKYAVGRVLNVGCESNPVGFGTFIYPDAVNVDIDRWEGVPNFVQASALALPFADRSFDTVVLGDTLEHVEDRVKALEEACRVAKQKIVITLPTDATPEPEGRHIKHIEFLKTLGLKETAPGDLKRRHAHDHAYTILSLTALVTPVFQRNGFTCWVKDTGAKLPQSPALGCVATRRV